MLTLHEQHLMIRRQLTSNKEQLEALTDPIDEALLTGLLARKATLEKRLRDVESEIAQEEMEYPEDEGWITDNEICPPRYEE